MKLPWKRREKQEASSPVEVVDIGAWNGRNADAITPIARPDSLSALNHPLPFTGPDQADLRLAVTQYIAALHQAGGIDAGHHAVLDHLIDDWLAEWLERVDQEAADRRRVTMRLLSVDQANFRAASVALGDAQKEFNRLQAEFEFWTDILSGQEATLPRGAEMAPAQPSKPLLPVFKETSFLEQVTSADEAQSPAIEDDGAEDDYALTGPQNITPIDGSRATG